MIDPVELANFVTSEDANDIIRAFNRLSGATRSSLIAHASAMAIEHAPNSVSARVMVDAIPEPANRPAIQDGRADVSPFFSESPEGRAVERHYRGESVQEIATAEFAFMVPRLAEAKVERIIKGLGKTFPARKSAFIAAAKTKSKSKKTRRQADAIQHLKTRVIELRKLGVGTSQISNEIGEQSFFVTRILAQARKSGMALPEINPMAEVPEHLRGRPSA